MKTIVALEVEMAIEVAEEAKEI